MLKCCFMLCVLSILVLVISNVDASGRLRVRRQGSVTNCAKSKLNTLPATCCKTTPKPLFTAAQQQSCNKKKDKNLANWANLFMLTTLQQPPNKNQTISLSAKTTQTTLCSAAEFINCLFKSNSLIVKSNGSIDANAAGAFLIYSQTDPKYQEAVAQIGNNIWRGLSQVDPAFKTIKCSANKYVSMLALLVVQSSQGALLEACPESQKTTKCDNMWNEYWYCGQIVVNQIFSAQLQQMSPASEPPRTDNQKSNFKKVYKF